MKTVTLIVVALCSVHVATAYAPVAPAAALRHARAARATQGDEPPPRPQLGGAAMKAALAYRNARPLLVDDPNSHWYATPLEMTDRFDALTRALGGSDALALELALEDTVVMGIDAARMDEAVEAWTDVIGDERALELFTWNPQMLMFGKDSEITESEAKQALFVGKAKRKMVSIFGGGK